MVPHYSYPPRLIASLLQDLLMVRRRSFHVDGQACIRRLKPALQIFGQENIPISGPCLVTVNHYYRPGFGAWWIPLAISAQVPVEIHWVTTGELTYPGKWYAPLGQVLSRWVLARVAKIYGFTTMPPMPPRDRDVAERARSVRGVLEHIRTHPEAVIGLAPEGMDNLAGVLSMPSPGAGRFVSLLANVGFPIVPVGCYEDAGALCLRFGPVYRLPVPSRTAAAERDRLASEFVMGKIAALLPVELRGAIVVH
jgi:hypothetical protein